jgi:hypothetical protein
VRRLPRKSSPPHEFRPDGHTITIADPLPRPSRHLGLAPLQRLVGIWVGTEPRDLRLGKEATGDADIRAFKSRSSALSDSSVDGGKALWLVVGDHAFGGDQRDHQGPQTFTCQGRHSCMPTCDSLTRSSD